ncbi:GntR family transcriptional regulator [Vibrio algicola]|uniref:FCD domain-containing protein n=1 Tax=Vibrio algicola TaxID=2662262 RepID=A0A5Q0TDV5_9VIBR|nr:GntR family transcriptional regulator [Vibrio algicola]
MNMPTPDAIRPNETGEKDETKSFSLTEYLIENIVDGTIAQGYKISEPEVARRLQVSRGPLREAMMRVEGLGLIERIPHVGARVITLTPEKLIELYQVREALEGMAARLAARFMTEETWQQLKQVLEAHAEHIEQVDGETYFQQNGDFDFHYQIILASKNKQLINMLCGELYHLVRMYRLQSATRTARPKRALDEHYFILQALRNKDEELAEMLMRRHIAASRKIIEAQLEQ